MRRLLGLVALVLAPVAGGASQGSPGVTPASILIGGVGAPSAFAKGAAAYFRYVNARGGVNGRTIEYRLSESAQQLVEQEQVFVLFGTVGTDATVTTDAYVEQARVPQLFVASVAAGLGRWTIGFPPSPALESAVLARQVRKTSVRGRIAVLYEDDTDGRALLTAFRHGLGSRTGQITATTNVAELRAGGAATFVVLGRATTSPGLPAGAVSVTYLKDTRDPRWAGDPALEKYRRTGGLKTTEHEAGMAAAFALVATLRRAGRAPTRASVLVAARGLNEADNPFLVPGIVVKPPIRQVALQRWSGGHWNVFTGPVAVAG